jgi:hypothetical protein
MRLNKIPDVYVGLLRQLLVSVGSVLLAKYGFDPASIGSLFDLGVAAVGGLMAFGSAAWMIWTKAGTTAVPDATAARKDVPTVNAVTGSVERTSK